MTHSVHFDIKIDGNPAGFIEQLADFRQALEKQGIKTTSTGDRLTHGDQAAMEIFRQILDKALTSDTDDVLNQQLDQFANEPGEFIRAGATLENGKLVIRIDNHTWELTSTRKGS